jgi:hypothetical protein
VASLVAAARSASDPKPASTCAAILGYQILQQEEIDVASEVPE